MLWKSLRALCLAPGGRGSIWNSLGAPVRYTGVSRRFACSFRTDLNFADVALDSRCSHLFSLGLFVGFPGAGNLRY
jgi:hypothetical protein